MKKYSFKFFSTIAIVTFSAFFAFPSLFDSGNNLPGWWGKHKVKLGLDLQGGSQLLLQVETGSAIKEKLQNNMEDIRVSLQKENLNADDISLNDDYISIKFN